jgi:hypothetical protein
MPSQILQRCSYFYGPLKSIPSSVHNSHHHRYHHLAPPPPHLTPLHYSASDSRDLVTGDPCHRAWRSFLVIQRWCVDLTSAKTFTTPPSPLSCVTDRSTGLHAARSAILRATHCRPPCQAPLPPPFDGFLRFCSQVLGVPQEIIPCVAPTRRRPEAEAVLLRLVMAWLISRARLKGSRRLRHSSSRVRILVCVFNLCLSVVLGSIL